MQRRLFDVLDLNAEFLFKYLIYITYKLNYSLIVTIYVTILELFVFLKPPQRFYLEFMLFNKPQIMPITLLVFSMRLQ